MTSSAIHNAYHPMCLENEKYWDDGIKLKKAKKKKKGGGAFRIQETRNVLVRIRVRWSLFDDQGWEKLSPEWDFCFHGTVVVQGAGSQEFKKILEHYIFNLL